MIESEAIAAGMARWFDETIGKIAFRLALVNTDGGSDKLVWKRNVDGESRVYTSEPNTSFWRRFGVGLPGLCFP